VAEKGVEPLAGADVTVSDRPEDDTFYYFVDPAGNVSEYTGDPACGWLRPCDRRADQPPLRSTS
jgi:hypothetical protein